MAINTLVTKFPTTSKKRRGIRMENTCKFSGNSFFQCENPEFFFPGSGFPIFYKEFSGRKTRVCEGNLRVTKGRQQQAKKNEGEFDWKTLESGFFHFFCSFPGKIQ